MNKLTTHHRVASSGVCLVLILFLGCSPKAPWAWKSFGDAKLGIALRYPPEFSIEPKQDGVILIYRSPGQNDHFAMIQVMPFDNPFFKQIIQNPEPSLLGRLASQGTELIHINGMPMLRITGKAFPDDPTYMVLPTDHVLMIHFAATDDELGKKYRPQFEKVLTTFKSFH